MSHISSIVYRPTDERPEDHFYRVPLAQAQLIVGHGIEGDARGGREDRHINLMAAETLALLATQGFQVAPGQMGEQIITAGVAIDALQPGDRLYLGASACLEVTIARRGCTRFQRIQGLSPALAAGHMGMIARVVTGGPIAVGDAVRVELAPVAR
ncbi:MAG: MOSC domain-containing protein [Anaerolineae bacterium]|jgi:MOSC domain-containing protein YiiM|nr:MOSC domain-containing protein [Anaerolineae bacterium]